MATTTKCTARTIALLLIASICAAAQQDAGLVYGARANRTPAGFRVKLANGLVDTPGTLLLEQGQVTIHNESGDDIVIPDQQLLDAVSEERGRSMPFIKLSTAFQCDDAREAAIFLSTAVAWDVVLGIASLFKRKRHFVTINYSQDGETRSETVRLSSRDAQKLVHELQLRRGIAFKSLIDTETQRRQPTTTQ